MKSQNFCHFNHWKTVNFNALQFAGNIFIQSVGYDGHFPGSLFNKHHTGFIFLFKFANFTPMDRSEL